MASVRLGVTIKRGGEYFPPGSELHGLSEEEAAELLPHSEPIEPMEALPAPHTGDVAPPPRMPGILPEAVPAPAEAPEEGNAAPISEPEEIAFAIDLLDASDFGADGRPDAAALAGVLGFAPDEADISTALALRVELGM